MYARSLGVPGGDPVMLDVRVAARLGFGEHGEGILERARLVLGLLRSQRSFAPSRRLRSQDGRALEEGGRCGQTTARLRPAGRPLELGGDTFVGRRACLSAVPGSTIGV